MSEDKPPDYRHRLSSNLHQLYHNEVGINYNVLCDVVCGYNYYLQLEYPPEMMTMQHHRGGGSGHMYCTGMMNQLYDHHTPSNLSAHSSHPSTPHTGGGGSIPNMQHQQPYMSDQHHMLSLNYVSF